jgi:ribosomal-protein-alanine N-acetyltransferase
MHIVIDTQRLLLRLFTINDGPLIFELNNDPDVIRYTHDPIRDLNHAQEVLEQIILPQYALYNYGRWAVHTKPDLEFIGWCGLKFRPERNEVDLGYRYKSSAWGKGYATEAAYAVIRYGFDKLGLQTITGHAEPANVASVRVLENIGMHFMREEKIDGHFARTYELSNPFIP